MPYQLGETFDLGRAYAQATQVQGAQQDQELRGLQIQGARRQLAHAEDISPEDAIAHARIAFAAASSVAQDPSDENLQRNYDFMKRSNSLTPEFDFESIRKMTPAQRQAGAQQWVAQLKPFLDNAVDPEKRDLAALASKDRQAAIEDRAQGRLDTIQSREDTAKMHDDTMRAIASMRDNGRADPAPAMTEVLDPKDPKRLLRVDARLYKGGSIGDPGVLGVSGKEPTAAKAAETRGTGQQGVTDLTVQLRDFYKQLREGHGVTDTEASPVGNAVTWAQTSGVGQAAGRMFGTQNQSLRNSIKQQRPLLLLAIKNATGMSAKQMDSNAELNLYLSAATDPELDYQANIAALDNIDRLYGTGVGSGAASAGGAASAQAAAPPAPAGVDAKLWAVMTPEERAAWQ